MKLGIISPEEKELLQKIEDSNTGENSLWKIPNLLIPIATIVVAIAAYAMFANKEFKIIAYMNLVINGSLPLIALNQISGLGVHIFKYDKSREREFGIGDTFYLRTRLFFLFLVILIAGVFLYSYQVINIPFESPWVLCVLILISLLLIWASTYTARKSFLLQEDFIENTFDNEMRDEIPGLMEDLPK